MRQLFRFPLVAVSLAAPFVIAARSRAADDTNEPPPPASAPSASVSASAEAADKQDDLGSVVVTARRSEEKLEDVPIAITAIGGDRAREEKIRSSEEIARFVPNMSAPATAGRARPRWFIRGLGVNDPSANVVSPIGVYRDDVYLGTSILQGFPLFDLERVEVLRGPQGTLWGRNTTGGAVHYVSKKPTFDYDGYGDFTFGTYGSRIVQGAAGGPIYGEKVAARVALYYETQNGFVDNRTTGLRAGDFRDSGARVQLLLAPIDAFDLLLNAHFRSLRQGTTPFFPIAVTQTDQDKFGFAPSGDLGNRFATYQNVDSNEAVDSRGSSATATVHAGPINLVSITAFEGATSTGVNDGDYTPIELSRSYAYINVKQWTQELRVENAKPGRLKWVLGGHYFWEKLYSDAASGALIPGRGSYQDTQYYQRTISLAAFANATFDFTEWLKLTAGARITNEKRRINLNAVNGGPPGTAAFRDFGNWWLRSSVASQLVGAASQQDERTWSAPTFDVSPQVKITKELLAYFRYARGFRSGGYNGGVQSQANVAVVEPETVDAFELGVKGRWLGGRATVSAAGFYYDFDKVQVLVNALSPLTNTSGTRLQNAGTGKVKGAEIEGEIHPTDNLRLRGAFAWLDTKFGDFPYLDNTGKPANAEGNEFTRAPHVSALADVELRIPVSKDSTLALQTDWNYRTRVFFNAVNQSSESLQQNAYAVGNARVSFYPNKEKLEISLFARNVVDTRYKILAIQAAGGNYAWIFGEPRVFGVSVGARFH